MLFAISSSFAQKDAVQEKEVRFRSRVRYIVVYNDIVDGERRLQVLLKPQNFDKASLIYVFDSIKQQYLEPKRLNIEVRTSLNMIETPEERNMLRDGEDSRFSSLYGKYKIANYYRFETGREAFVFTTKLKPYREKTVVLVDKPAF